MNVSLEWSSTGRTVFLAMPPVVPAEVKRFAPCKNSFVAAPRVIDLEIPSFLKRGPATADEVGLLPTGTERLPGTEALLADQQHEGVCLVDPLGERRLPVAPGPRARRIEENA